MKPVLIDVLDNVRLEIWILLGIVHRFPNVVSECLGVILIFDYDAVHWFKSQRGNGPLRSFFLFFFLVHSIDSIQHRYNDCFESLSRLLGPADSFVADDSFKLVESLIKD